MNKKIISMFTLLAFVVFSISCYTMRLKEVKTTADLEGKKAKILSVVKTSGEYIEFSKDNPGRIYEDKITGTATIMSKKVEIERADVKKIRKHSDGRIFEVINKDGKIYQVVGMVKEEDDKFILFTAYTSLEKVSIPLSEIKSAQTMIRSTHPGLIFLASIGALGALAVGCIGILFIIALFSAAE